MVENSTFRNELFRHVERRPHSIINKLWRHSKQKYDQSNIPLKYRNVASYDRLSCATLTSVYEDLDTECSTSESLEKDENINSNVKELELIEEEYPYARSIKHRDIATRTASVSEENPLSMFCCFTSGRWQSREKGTQNAVQRSSKNKAKTKEAKQAKSHKNTQSYSDPDLLDLMKVSPVARCNQNDVPVIIWDFAGQAILYHTHQTYLSYRCVYLLVFDFSKELTSFVDDEDLDPSKKKKATVLCM